jgi:hypothetical protein
MGYNLCALKITLPFLMKISAFQSLLLMSSMLIACSSDRNAPEQIPTQSFPLDNGEKVMIILSSGMVTLHASEESELVITGFLSYPEKTKFDISADNEHVNISAEFSRSFLGRPSQTPVELDILVPNDTTLEVRTFDADVALHGIYGNVTVDSVAGDIFAEDTIGSVLLRSGRGDVTSLRNKGIVRVLGEHGYLTIEDTHGDISSSTIMGKIQIFGTPTNGDNIRLRTDHGWIRAELKPGTAVTLSIRSIHGMVYCIPGLTSTTRTCDGLVGENTEEESGYLDISSVSGEIRIRSVP